MYDESNKHTAHAADLGRGMDLADLSSNWKKLQATFKKSDVAKSSSKLTNQNGLKRKREQSKATITKPSLLPRKKLRRTRTMAQGGTAAKATVPIQDLEKSDNGGRPRPADRASSDKVNDGLSTSSVAQAQGLNTC